MTSTVPREPELGSPTRMHAGADAVRPSRRWAPVRYYASLLGWGARRSIPRPLRRPTYGAFSRLVGADLGEVERDLAEYPTFGDFFARRLRAGARSFQLAPDQIASPCDGTVAITGVADEGTLVQAKGHHYRLEDLVASRTAAARLAGGWYCTIYLSPADYHRVHAPVSGRVVAYEYVPGRLWPVKPFFVRTVSGLLARNERAIIHLETAAGLVAIVLVGAVGVGNLWLAHAPEPMDRLWRVAGERRRVELARPVLVERGDELGAFLLGSTVVMVFPPGRVTPDAPPPGTPVRCGQPLGRLVTEAR